MNAFTPLYLPQLGVPPADVPAWTGAIVSLSNVVGIPFLPFWDALADRFGHWRVLFAGSILAVFLWPVPGFMSNLVSFAIVWAILNGLVSGIFAISFSVLSGSASSEVRGRVMSFAYLPVNVGFMVGPAIGSVVTQLSIFGVFPTAAFITALGVGALSLAARIKPAQEVSSTGDVS
jgi:MFS family permease